MEENIMPQEQKNITLSSELNLQIANPPNPDPNE